MQFFGNYVFHFGLKQANTQILKFECTTQGSPNTGLCTQTGAGVRIKVFNFFFFQGLTSSPPRDLNTLLIEIRIPDDIDKSPWAKQFREHLTSLNQPEKEAMFDFVLGWIFLSI